MNHQDIRERLDDYVDGALPEAEFLEIEQHLERCAECRHIVEDIRSLLKEAQSLHAGIEPGRDLWPGIAIRISGKEVVSIKDKKSARHHIWARQPLLAAATIVVVAVTALMMIQLDWKRDLMQKENLLGSAVLVEFDQVDAQFEAARMSLFSHLRERSSHWAGKTLEAMNKNVQVVDRAIHELRTALQADPTDTRLVHMLRREYQRKTTLLRQTAELLGKLDSVGSADSLT